MSTSTILVVVMVVSAVVMMFGLSKQKAGKVWGKPVAILGALVALGCAIGHMVMTSGGQDTQKIVQNEREYQRISGEKLGRYLAATYPDTKALIILDPSTKVTPDNPNSLVDGLKQGLAGKVETTDVTPEIPEAIKKQFAGETPEGMSEADMLPPMEMWFTATMMDALIAAQGKDCDLIITTVGLPQDMARMKFWKLAPVTKKKMVVARGSVFELKNAIAQKLVAAALSYNPKAEWDDKAPSADIEEAFNKRFLLVTPENVKDVDAQYPNALFSK